MVLSKVETEENNSPTEAKKRRIRRKKALARINAEKAILAKKVVDIPQPTKKLQESCNKKGKPNPLNSDKALNICEPNIKKQKVDRLDKSDNKLVEVTKMSKEPSKAKEDILAAREAKKQAKQKAKTKTTDDVNLTLKETSLKSVTTKSISPQQPKTDKVKVEAQKKDKLSVTTSKDEVDKAVVIVNNVTPKLDQLQKVKTELVDKNKDEVKAVRAAKKQAKQAKKGAQKETGASDNDSGKLNEISNKSVVETLDKIVDVVEEVTEASAKLAALKVDSSDKKEESGKSKAELKAERRAKQEAQRAAKTAAQSDASAKVEKPKAITKTSALNTIEEKKSPKPKVADKTLSKPKTLSGQRFNWFQHFYTEWEEASHKRIGINSNLHPAIVKLGVQLASRVVSGSNARCIALLNALKQVVRDYTLPAKTEFSRGLESYLATCLTFLWSMRKPSSTQTNAIKYFRYHLQQLPNNVNEFEAKTTLQEAIDTYIREQIDMAGQAISLSVRQKICNGDNILTYGSSSLIEEVLRGAWSAGVRYRAVVCGARAGGGRGARRLLRRLRACGVPCLYVDVASLNSIMGTVNKVLVGACSLLVNGWLLGAAGTALVALAARAHNVPLLVCCERHKFSERVQTDAFLYNEIGDPEELLDGNENSPLKDWRTNPNITLLNLTYDVTPDSLVTAVATDLAILPCSSAPVVLRFMLSEYGF